MTFSILSYTTPKEFGEAFTKFSEVENYKNVRLISGLIFVIAFVTRIFAISLIPDYDNQVFYREMSVANWIAICGYSTFFGLSFLRLRSGAKKLLYRTFVLFLLGASLNFSRVISLHNTKNTLLILLVGIIVTAIFFTLSYRELLFVVFSLFVAFLFTITFEKITTQEKALNVVAGFLVSMVLFVFSRYSFYFKSRHFVEVKLLKQKNAEIAALIRQNTDILAYVAHDLRSPLANIEMLNNILLEEHPQLDEPKLIGRATQSAKAIIGDLLEALQRNKTELKLERVNLNGFMSKLLEQWKNQTERNLNCTIPNETLTIVINPEKFQRVLDNLIQNAHKFSKSEKPIDVLITRLDNKVSIAVRDYGIGIPQKDLDKVFDQFSPASRVGLKGERSFGIGLHIAKKMIELQKGTLKVESVENAGSTFTIEIACEVEPAVKLIKT